MKSTVKKLIMFILCGILLLTSTAIGFAQEGEASLYNVYGDGMLLQQKKEAIFAGTAPGGAEVSCVLSDEGGNPVIKTKAYANRSGEFALSFTAPEGGYKSYTADFYLNGKLFRTLRDVVFGELWLTSGQSNMQYGFSQSDTYNQNSQRSEWLRFLYIEPYPTYNGVQDEFPLDPMKDIEAGNCRWVRGTDNIGAVSAVSFFFAQELQKKLDMPVGVLLPNLGGSMLASWLSRETADSDLDFAAYLKEKGNYLSVEEWKSSDVDWVRTVTANYNKKIYPLRNFRVAGMLWYQGESEIMLGWEKGYYKKGLELLQSSFGELFGFEGAMPFIATQVVPFAYGDNSISIQNNEFIEFQKADPASRAVSTIYDIDPGYYENAGSIHPKAKQPVGERMEKCAEGLVYGMSCCYTAAAVSSSRIDGSNVYVTFENAGDGLLIDGAKAIGFSLCGEDGVFVQANAESVGNNTLKIFSDEVKAPAAAAYAFAENNTRANVWSTVDGEKFMPIAPFCTDIQKNNFYWEEPQWADCDLSEAWQLTGDNFAGIHDLWSAENAEISVDASLPFEGIGSLRITAEGSGFSVSPVFTYQDGKDTEYFDRMLTDWSKYSAVSVMVRNNSSESVELKNLKISTGKLIWFAPEVNDSGEPGTVIPADGEWHRLTFDLDRIYICGNECAGTYSRVKLDDITGFSLCFKGEGADISVDDFRFTGDGSEGHGVEFEQCIGKADNVWEFICSLFTSFFSIFSKIFG